MAVDLLPDLPDVDLLPDVPDKSGGTGFAGIGEDIYQGAANLPDAIYQMLASLPGEAYGAGKQAVTNPGRFGRNALAGLAEGGAGILNTPGNIRDYIVNKGLAGRETPSFRLPESVLPRDYNYPENLGVQGEEQGDALVRALSGAAPYVLGGELGALGKLGRMGARGGAQAAYAAGQNENPVTAALMVPGIELPLRAAGKVGSVLKDPTPSGYVAKNYRGPLTAEELAENMRAAENTNTPLGDVVSSPRLKQRFENEFAPVLGSKADDLFGAIEKQVRERGEDALKYAGKGVEQGDVNFILQEALKNERQKSKGIKNKLYENVSKTAEQQGFEAKTPSFSKLAKEDTAAIENSELYKHNDKFRAAYRKIVPFKNTSTKHESMILDKNGMPMVSKVTHPTISEVKMVANQLDREASKMLKSNDPTLEHIGNKYAKLAKAAREDVNEGIKQRGTPELKTALEEADKFYRENYSRFRDKEVHDLIKEGKSGQKTVREVVKPSQVTDEFQLIDKVKDILPKNMSGAMGYGHLKGAVNKKGEVRPQALNKKIATLGNRQFKSLFDTESQQHLTDFQNLVRMNKEALSRLENPKTGARNKDKRSLLPGYVTTGTLGASKLLEPMIANYLTEMLTDPKFRQKVVKKMSKTKPKTATEEMSKTKPKTFTKERLHLGEILVPYSVAANTQKEKR